MTNCRKFLSGAAIILAMAACVPFDGTLGESYIPTSSRYDTYTASIPLEDIHMSPLDSLTGYSANRFVVGAIRDKDFGLIKKTCAFSIVPTKDTLDFGEDPKMKFFVFTAGRDTVSIPDETQACIFQNLNIFELEEPVRDTNFLNRSIRHGNKRITSGLPRITSTDDLYFTFSKEFGEKYMNTLRNDLHSKSGIDSLPAYLDKLPGIYMETDDPMGYGGRFNFFDVQLNYAGNTRTYIGGNCAMMGISTKYNGVEKDTTFYFYFGPYDFYNLDSLSNVTKVGYLPQRCLNMTFEDEFAAQETDGKYFLEGGAGPKMVFSADEIRRKVTEEIGKKGNPSSAVINKATLKVYFEFPDDYEKMFAYPTVLSPTSRISNEKKVSFASITDSSSETESIGRIDRDHLNYAPDITYHVQELVKSDDLDKKDMKNYDVWTFILAEETRETTTSSQAEADSYNEYMQYMNYYQMMYGDYSGYGYGGYGYGGYGYGGYGNYGYGYNNYYYYNMMAQSMSGTTTNVTTELDLDRFYKAVLYGPGVPDKNKRPMLCLTYSIPKE